MRSALVVALTVAACGRPTRTPSSPDRDLANRTSAPAHARARPVLLCEPLAPSGTLYGSITFMQDGEPLTGASIFIRSTSATTLGEVTISEDGCYRRGGLTPGSYKIDIYYDDAHFERTHEITGGNSRLDLELDATKIPPHVPLDVGSGAVF